MSQFFLVNIFIVINIEIPEGLAHSAPLLRNLRDKLDQDVSAFHCLLRSHLLVISLFFLLLRLVHLILRIALRIVSEDETCQVMNFVTHPAAEVVIIESAGPVSLRVYTLHDFDQVSILNRDVRPVHRDNVLRFYQPVMILVNRQKRLID